MLAAAIAGAVEKADLLAFRNPHATLTFPNTQGGHCL
jgi:hypothetical protein